MPMFAYQARDPSGGLVTARAEAETERDLVARLRQQGLLVVEVGQDRDLQRVMLDQYAFLTRRVSSRELAVFARQFATMINAGLPVLTALRVMVKQSANPRLQRALSQIAAEIEAGEGLTDAFTRHRKIFPPVMLQMLSAGEVGGILEQVLVRLATQLEREEVIRQKVRSAMVYPTMVSSVAVLTVTFLMIFVVPRFVELYTEMGTSLPAATQLLIAASRWLQRFWWLAGGAAVAIAIGLRLGLRTEEGARLRDRLVLEIPIFGPMARKYAIARFARTLSALLCSGIPILKALAVTEKAVGNRIYADTIRRAMEVLRAGEYVGGPLRASGLFPPMTLEMLSIGEETGTMEEMLARVADFYEDEVQRSAERLSASLEPLIILLLAITVGFVVVAMMLPIFNIWSAF